MSVCGFMSLRSCSVDRRHSPASNKVKNLVGYFSTHRIKHTDIFAEKNVGSFWLQKLLAFFFWGGGGGGGGGGGAKMTVFRCFTFN